MTYRMSGCVERHPSGGPSTGWCCHLQEPGYVHVHPLRDLVAHTFDRDGECVCGPTAERLEDDDGGDAWMWTHHSLDGRERHEPR